MNFGDYSVTAYIISQLGRYGVELFFVISGYLACFSLNKNNGASVIAFYKKRIIRILPLYYLCILYFFITETFFFGDVPSDPQNLGWLRYLFSLNGIVPSEGYFWSNIGITWTIPVFMLFYLLAPLLVKISKSFFSSVSVLVVAVGLAYVTHRYFSGWLSAFSYLPCFIFGIIVYNAKNERKQFICLLGLILFVILFKWADIANGFSEFVNDIFTLSALFSVMIIMSENYFIKSSQLTRVYDFLDEHSYTIYLVHGIVFCGIIDKFEISMIPKVLIAIVGTALLACIVHRFFEKPIQGWLKRILL